MREIQTVPIDTSRLILRRIRLEDAEEAYLNWASSREVTRHLGWKPMKNVAETYLLFTDLVRKCGFHERGIWTIRENRECEAIGAIELKRSDTIPGALEAGYAIGESWWGQGLVPEALSAVLEHAFSVLEAEKVVARYYADNSQSERVLEKCGMAPIAGLGGSATCCNEGPEMKMRGISSSE